VVRHSPTFVNANENTIDRFAERGALRVLMISDTWRLKQEDIRTSIQKERYSTCDDKDDKEERN
jgi:hypothetical protein